MTVHQVTPWNRFTTVRHSTTIFSLASAVMILASCGSGKVTESSDNPTLERLRSAVSNGCFLYAHEDDLSYGHTWRVSPEEALTDSISRSDVKMVCGDFPAIMGFDLGGIELGNECNLDDVSFAFMKRAAIEHHRRGGIITYSWHPKNPLTGGDAWDTTSSEVVKSILDGGQCHDAFMGWLSNAADFLDGLRDAQGNAIPVIFRPWHEHTGSWFWWGRELCTTEEYTALWKMTYDYLTGERGLSHMVWAYSPGAGNSEEIYMERYPGDEMVDLLGLDCYQYGSDEDFMKTLDDALTYMDRLGEEHGKVTALTEAGFEGITEPHWWTGVLAPVLARHKASYVLTWRNAWNIDTHFYAAWPGSADADDFRAFHDMGSTCFLNDIR